MPSRDDALDAAADVEVADDLHEARRAGRRQVVQDAVHCTFVEDAVVAVAPQIELEALQLQAEGGRHVGNADRAEIGGAALEQRELRGIGLDPA